MTLILLALFCISFDLLGQVIRGKVIDAESKMPLAYVNIGVMNIAVGTASNESGEYKLNCDGLPLDSKIRISMIGYLSQTYTISDLLNDSKTIKLDRKTIELEEVVVRWKENTRKVGIIKKSITPEVCGFGGTDFGKGHELGMLLDLGSETVKVEDINLRVYKQSFDTIFFRLHFRSIEDGLPSEELLIQNIYLPIFILSGWQKIDLKEYDILLKGTVALTIEWVRISNVIEKNLIKVNSNKKASPNVLFNVDRKNGTFFCRWGSEATWEIKQNYSPVFYITIKE